MATTTGVVQHLSLLGTGTCVLIGPTPSLSDIFTIQYRTTDSAWVLGHKKSMIAVLVKAEIAGLPVTVDHSDTCWEITGITLEAIKNPSLAGTFTWQQVVYAAPGLNYSANPSLGQFNLFDTPHVDYTTRTIDISDFANFSANWPFSNTNAPINGLCCIPDGPGPFPLAVIAHGNHSAFENSTPGYVYLLNLLASHGILAATIDVNFLNGFNFGENDGRAIVHLEHVKQFRIWHEQSGHPLEGKVDLSRIMIVGHSRGGEAVGHASLFNQMSSVQPDFGSPSVPLNGSQGLGPYFFDLKAVAAIAPTDGQYVPVSGLTAVRDNYFLIHGSRDNDVYTFAGFKTYDRSHRVDLGNPTQSPERFKSLAWVHGANHNFFNSVWNQESFNTISRPDQEQIAKVYLSALAQAMLLNVKAYMNLFRNYTLGTNEGWFPAGVPLVSEYHDPQRLYLQHFEEPGTAIAVSAPASGTVNTSQITAAKLNFNLGPNNHLYQETHGLRLDWNTPNRQYLVSFNPTTLASGMFGYLSFRIGQSFETNNPANTNQAFTILASDGTQTASLTSTLFQSMIYPGTSAAGASPKTVMQSFRIPLTELQNQGVDTLNLSTITLAFNQTPAGTVYFDDLQLTD